MARGLLQQGVMPFCPRCRSEFIPGMTRCSDCDADLVAALPESLPPADYDWVDLGTTDTEPEGELLRGLLEARGIPVIVKKDVFLSGFGRQGTLLMVPAEHHQTALGILQEQRGPAAVSTDSA